MFQKICKKSVMRLWYKIMVQLSKVSKNHEDLFIIALLLHKFGRTSKFRKIFENFIRNQSIGNLVETH